MGFMIKTHPDHGHGHNKDVPIPGVPTFQSAQEAYDWANNAGAAQIEAILKDQFDQGEVNFTFDYS